MGIDPDTKSYLDTCRTELPESLPDHHLVHGFDGYCDRVRTMVETREDPANYNRMDTLASLAERINDSVELKNSCSIEWVNDSARAGGHTSHLGRTFSRLGFEPTLIGTFGEPPESIFTDTLDGGTIRSVGEPSYTDAVEFNDGKLMLNEIGTMASLDWDHLHESVSMATLVDDLDGAAALSMGYWATMPYLPSIWRGLVRDVWPLLNDPPNLIFVDPADIRRMSEDGLRSGIDALSALDDTVPVVVSANRAETKELASIADETATGMETQARVARELLDVSQFVAHAVDSAVLVDGETVSRAETPHVVNPALTTSAGDHFNAGFLLGQILSLDGPASLVLGNAVANWFVRNGEPPTYSELLSFLSRFESYFE